MSDAITIGGRRIGAGEPAFIIAEMSANHGQDYEQAVRLVHAAADAGVDAIKLQTYLPETMTIACDAAPFQIAAGTIWEGRNLFDLYQEAYTPWDWQPRLKRVAEELGLMLFSTPFDATAVDFLEQMDVPAHKVASFELVDLPLLRRIGQTGKPVIMSTGMGTLEEIAEAVRTLREAGTEQLALLKCTSAYPAPPEEMDLRTIPHLAQTFDVPTGLSDHTLGVAVPVAAVALGACIIEKHYTLSRDDPGPDSSFSLEPAELATLVREVRVAEQAVGRVNYNVGAKEVASRIFRRSLFVVAEVKAGEVFTERNVRCIRPGHGLHPRNLERVMGRRATADLALGTPLTWEHVG